MYTRRRVCVYLHQFSTSYAPTPILAYHYSKPPSRQFTRNRTWILLCRGFAGNPLLLAEPDDGGRLLGNGAEARHEIAPAAAAPPGSPAPLAWARGGGGHGRFREHERPVVVAHERGAGAHGERGHLLGLQRPPPHRRGEHEVELPGLQLLAAAHASHGGAELQPVRAAEEPRAGRGRRLRRLRRARAAREPTQRTVRQDHPRLRRRAGVSRRHRRGLARVAGSHGRACMPVRSWLADRLNLENLAEFPARWLESSGR
jgi:hypothetical protein